MPRSTRCQQRSCLGYLYTLAPSQGGAQISAARQWIIAATWPVKVSKSQFGQRCRAVCKLGAIQMKLASIAIGTFIAIVTLFFLTPIKALAQSNGRLARTNPTKVTYVSGLGNDNNLCTAAAPCRSL